MKNELDKPRVSLARNTARGIIAELDEITIPVKISSIVSSLKRKRGINIEIYKRDLGKNTRGIQVTEKVAGREILIIGYDEKQHDHSKRFTVAHELGHFLLGHTRDGHEHYLEFFDEGSGDPKEIEANQFAAEILIPSSLLKIDIDCGIKDVPTLSRKYWVSEMAMWKKVLDLNLVKKL